VKYHTTLEEIIEINPGLIASSVLYTVDYKGETKVVFSDKDHAHTYCKRFYGAESSFDTWPKSYFKQEWLQLPFNPRIV